MNNYYRQKQIIARIDKKGKVIGQIDKWEAHRKGMLHKALTIALVYENQLVIQHRKHPAFDGILDITSSSHQIFRNGKLQSTLEAAYETLEREWNIQYKDLVNNPKFVGTVYYKSKDNNSEFTEHELCNILVGQVSKLPRPNFDFAYGFSLATKKEVLNKKGRIYKNLAPWVIKAIKEKLI